MNDTVGIGDFIETTLERDGKIIDRTPKKSGFWKRLFNLKVIAISINPNKSVAIVFAKNNCYIKEM